MRPSFATHLPRIFKIINAAFFYCTRPYLGFCAFEKGNIRVLPTPKHAPPQDVAKKNHLSPSRLLRGLTAPPKLHPGAPKRPFNVAWQTTVEIEDIR